MRTGAKVAAALGLVALAGFGIAWWWTHHMERRFQAVPTFHSGDGNDFRALGRFLAREGVPVEHGDHLDEVVSRLGKGETIDQAIFLPAAPSQMPTSLAKPLLSWVERGGTLVVGTPWMIDSSDQLLQALGVRIRGNPDQEEEEDTTEGLARPADEEPSQDACEPASRVDSSPLILPGLPAPEIDSNRTADGDDLEDSEDAMDTGISVRLPGVEIPLRLQAGGDDDRLYLEAGRAEPVWRDSLDSTLLVVSRKKGFVVVASNTWNFSNSGLHDADHAEILLRLLEWKSKPTRLWLVRDADQLPWWKILWRQAGGVVLAALLLALMWAWSRARRLGPLLAEAGLDRRPLLEHVDASARWIWKAPLGPETLLQALRSSVQRILRLRHPAWSKLPLDEFCRELASLHEIPATELQHALADGASPTPREFVRMVRILQKLKERT